MTRKLITGLLFVCASAGAQSSPAVAIVNAKIVRVSGPALARGTVVVRNGLIEAVGENVAVPADAWVVAGEGLTVYPGLIDPLSTVGIEGAPNAAATAGRGGRGAATPATPAAPAAAPAAAVERARGPEDRPSTTSWLLAADELQPTDRRIETVRSAGYTTTATFPTRGIFAGQGSLIDLSSGEKAGDMVVVTALGQYISLSRGGGFGGGFPSALMGMIAYVRQIYLDAAHYQLVKDAYAKDPRGMERPAYDRALEGVLASKRILFPANRLVEIDRMLRFAAELKQPVVIYGGRETYRPEAVEVLKKAGAPVLVSMRWPEAPRDPNPEDTDSLRVLEQRDKAPGAPALLEKAGVHFALYTDGLEQPRDIQRAVKKAIDAGLSREDAVRALTLSPAEIYGVADRMGSIDKGKIANLLVTKGEIFEDRTSIQMIFVDGRKYTPATDSTGGGRGMTTNPPGGIQ